MAKKKSSREYHIYVAVTNALYTFPVHAATLQEALDKGKELVNKNIVPELGIVDCMDEHSEVAGVYEVDRT